jgi:lysophospholipase L1-like esterase
MKRRCTLVAGLLLAVLMTACGSSSPPTGPGPIVTPPPDPGPSPTPTPTPPPTLGITRILAFGDSMTEGTTSPTFSAFTLTPGLPQSYPYKLQSLLTRRYTGQTITVANAGLAGERATETRPSTRDRFNRALSEARPELVILLEGANDLNNLPDGVTNVSLIVGAMEDMVRDAQGRGSQVILGTEPQQRPGQPNTQHASLVPRYNDELRSMAAKKGAMLVDLNTLVPLSLIGQDGLHPTEEAYEMMAGIFFDTIKSRYELVTAAR